MTVLPTYICPSCRRKVVKPKGMYSCKRCGPDVIMQEVTGRYVEKDPLITRLDDALDKLSEALAIAEKRPLLPADIEKLTSFIDELADFRDALVFG